MKRILALCFCLSLTATKLDGETSPEFTPRVPDDLHHEVLTTWTTAQGLPQNFITALEQTQDGFLWVGTLGGLARFDGVRFRSFANDGPRALQDRISGLARDNGGGLWIGAASGLFHLTHNEFHPVLCQPRIPCPVESLTPTDDGGVWVFTGSQLLRSRGDQLESVSLPFDPRELRTICEDQTRTLWITNGESVFAVPSSPQHTGDTPSRWRLPGIHLLYAAPSGEVYAGDGHRLFRFEDRRFVLQTSPGLGNFVSVTVDSRHRLWMASGGLHGVSRQSGSVTEYLIARDGLASDDVRRVFEDRDHDIWLGTIAGLQRLHRGLFTTYTARDGLPDNRSQFEGIFEDRAGTLWAGTVENGVARLEGGTWHTYGPREGLPAGQVRGFADGLNGPVVALSDYGLFSWRAAGSGTGRGHFVAVPGIPRGYFTSPVRASDSLWFGILGHGLFRLQKGGLTQYGVANGLLDPLVWVVQPMPNGHLFVGTNDGLSEWTGASLRTIAATADAVLAIAPIGSGDLALGTLGGMVLLHNGKPILLTQNQGMPANLVLSIVEDHLHNLWIATANSIVRIPRAQIDAVLAGRAATVSPEVFTEADGLRGAAVLPVNQINMFSARDGRLWLATAGGISVIDPHLPQEPAPVAVLDGISVDDRPYLPRDADIEPGRHRILIEFTSSTLFAADQLRFRYRMHGWDTAWIDAGKLREAVYTGLPPGSYRFEVEAINRDGTVSAVPDAIDLRLKPFFWQTRIFFAVIILAAIALIVEITRRRTRAAAERLSLRFQERASERERIAYQIHDTVIQDMIGTALKLELLGHQMAEEPLVAQQGLDNLAARMRETIARSRTMVSSLHSTAVPQYSLLDLLKNSEAEFRLSEKPEFHLITEGDTRPLHPYVRDEVYRICREALANGFRHAGASLIEVRVRFAPDTLDVEIADDGQGMDDRTREHGRPGHFGLRGMQAHADRIDSTLTIDSSPRAGTCVRLHVKTKRWTQGRLRRWLHSHQETPIGDDR